MISADTWRHEVAREACAAGADLINDTWGGWDRRLAEVAAEFGAGLVCAHAGTPGAADPPVPGALRRRGGRRAGRTLAQAARAAAAGVDPARILIDPAHDFGKNTWHSLEMTRRLDEMARYRLAGPGVAVQQGLRRRDAGRCRREARLAGTLATTAVCAWLGARVFRAHQVRETRQVLTMVSAIRGEHPPARAVRGLA